MNIKIEIDTDTNESKVNINGREIAENGSMKRCPFCGGEPLSRVYNGKIYVECEACAAQTDFYDTENEAIEKWNRRS